MTHAQTPLLPNLSFLFDLFVSVDFLQQQQSQQRKGKHFTTGSGHGRGSIIDIKQ
jgi:hypothetical protein